MPAGVNRQEGWWAVEITCHPILTQAALWRLAGPGHRGCAVHKSKDDVHIWAYLASGDTSPLEMAKLYLGLHLDAGAKGLPAPQVDWDLVASWDWPDEYKARVQPQPVGDRLLITHHWLSVDDADREVLRIDSRLGFGTGAHPTTRMCLEALERHVSDASDRHDLTIADIGCGSGILGIGALLLGAARVYAVDTKLAAVQGTVRNAELNRIAPERITVQQGSVRKLEEMLPAPVDGFVCNILAYVITGLAPALMGIVKPGGWGVLSGVRDSEMDALGVCLERHGWELVDLAHRDGWCRIDVRKPTVGGD